ncbi:MAG: DUF896 domain-containing protein [Clostridia bacterium]|nr:DUF896 domain-containing protein [Clostridia bacterium]MBQ4543846.1 DUF896 domain-containing protein [Clostridia bacterium]MBQ7075459.1 DUF896 domain-containing protein [Clostridia bacterium]MBQ9997724.1 DUF896 domain-containing protein [Clostridia bacterium]
MDKKLIDEINRLAKKQRECGLTEEETALQGELRKQYLTEFRANFRQILDNVEVVDGEPQ